MKIITIGDLHGSQVWKEIYPGAWDHMIFIGDYVDSNEWGDDEVTRNLREIIELKNSFPEKVILLWGNHDLCYFYGGHERHFASGFRRKMLPELFSLFTAHRKLFQAAFGIDNHLWTHAGVVKEWYTDYLATRLEPDDRGLAGTLNRLFGEYYLPLYHAGMLRGGLHHVGGIFWADRRELEEDPLPGYHQVVGHTKTRSGIMVSNHYGEETSVTWVDCLNTETVFFSIEIP